MPRLSLSPSLAASHLFGHVKSVHKFQFSFTSVKVSAQEVAVYLSTHTRTHTHMHNVFLRGLNNGWTTQGEDGIAASSACAFTCKSNRNEAHYKLTQAAETATTNLPTTQTGASWHLPPATYLSLPLCLCPTHCPRPCSSPWPCLCFSSFSSLVPAPVPAPLPAPFCHLLQSLLLLLLLQPAHALWPAINFMATPRHRTRLSHW